MKKSARVFVYLILILVILLGSLYFISQPLLKGLMDEKFEEARIGGLYKIKAKTAYFDIFNLGVSLKDVQIYPDSLSEAFQHSPTIADLKINRVSLSYLNIWELINNNKLKVGKIKIVKPDLNIHFLNRETIPKDSNKTAEEQHLELDIDGIVLSKMKVQLNLKNKSVIDIKRIDFEIKKPVIYLNLFPDILNAIEYESIAMKMESLSHKDPKSVYDFSLNEVEIENHLKHIKISGINLVPKYNKKIFAEKHPYQIDRFLIELDRIDVHDFDIEKLINNEIIAIGNINLVGLQMEVYRDKSRPFNFNKFPKLPQQQIRGIKQKLEINQIQIKNSHIVYLERIPDATKSGRVDFENLEAVITHFGNSENWLKEKELKISANTKIYNKTAVFTQMNFPLGSNTFYVSGQVEESPMFVYNEIVTPNADIKILDGKIDKLDFSFSANNQSSNGEMTFLYKDLEIDILKEKETGEIKERKFLNLIVNNILLPKQNPNKKGEEYRGVIAFERDKNKGIFNYLWKSIFTGIKDTFLKDHKDIQDYTIEKEEAKQSKKDLRKKKREERKKRREKKNK